MQNELTAPATPTALPSQQAKRRWLRRMVRRLPTIRYAKHCWTRCALKVCVNQYGINQCDAMIFGICIYWCLPRWEKMEQIHITAGLWKSQVFSHGEIYDVVVLLRRPPNDKLRHSAGKTERDQKEKDL